MHILSTILAALLAFFSGPTTTPPVAPVSYPQVIHSSVNLYDIDHIAATEADLVAQNKANGILGASNVIETPVAVFHTSLANAISSSATAMTLVSGLTADGTTLASSTYSFVIDSGQSDQEFVIADCTNTVCTNMQRGLSVLNGTSTVASNAQVHRRTATVDIVDAPILLKITSILNGISGLPNLISYNAGTDCVPGHNTHVICSGSYLESYANNVIAGGSPTSTTLIGGKVLLGTLAQQAASFNGGANAPTVLQTTNATSTCQVIGSYALIASTTTGKLDPNCIGVGNYTFTNLLTLNGTTTINSAGGLLNTASSTFVGTTTILGITSANKIGQTFTSATTTSSWPLPIIIATSTGFISTGSTLLASSTIDFVGFSQGNLTSGTQAFIQTSGIVSGFTGLSAGKDYYIQDAGGIGTSVGTLEAYVGTAISTTQLELLPPRQLQYSGSISTGTAVPPWVRELVFSVSGSVSGFGYAADLVVKNVGITSATSQQVDFGGGSASYGIGCSFTNSSCSSSGSGTLTGVGGTAYMYR